jgi:hypothetical protein
LFGGSGVLPGFTIGNQKYPKGPKGLSGPNPPPLGSDGCPTKILSSSLGIFVCMLTKSSPLGIYGLNFIPRMVWVGVVVNGALVTITRE